MPVVQREEGFGGSIYSSCLKLLPMTSCADSEIPQLWAFAQCRQVLVIVPDAGTWSCCVVQ
jgi:hypothetical protein